MVFILKRLNALNISILIMILFNARFHLKYFWQRYSNYTREAQWFTWVSTGYTFRLNDCTGTYIWLISYQVKSSRQGIAKHCHQNPVMYPVSHSLPGQYAINITSESTYQRRKPRQIERNGDGDNHPWESEDGFTVHAGVNQTSSSFQVVL